MPKHIVFITHTQAELAALVHSLQLTGGRVWAIGQQDGALLFQLDTPNALRLHTQLRALRAAPPESGCHYLNAWLAQAQTQSQRMAAALPASHGVVLSYRGQDCRGQSFAQQDLRAVDFSDTDLRGVDFSGANLQGALFHRAQLGAPPSWWADWVVASLRRIAGWGWHYIQRNLCNVGTRFRGADLRGADFSGAHIGVVNFHAANLAHCVWRGANWRGPLWVSDTRLHHPKFIALLTQGSRSESDFSRQDLSDLDLSWFDLSGFDFRAADLRGTYLSHARLTAADLSEANLNASTCFTDVACDYIIWPEVDGGRWPPSPEVLQPDDFARWFQVLPTGIVFLARGLAQLQAGLQVLSRMQLELQQIKLAEAVSEVNLQAVFHLQIALPPPDQWPADSYTRLCQQVWLGMQQPVADQADDQVEPWFSLFARTQQESDHVKL